MKSIFLTPASAAATSMPCASITCSRDHGQRMEKATKENFRAKLTKKDPPKDQRRHPKGEELTVQRLSLDVSEKAHKYTRVGPREFAPFDDTEEMTIGNIKSACERYFIP